MNILAFTFTAAFLFSCNGSVDTVKESQDLLNTDKAFSQMSVEKGASAAFEFYCIDDILVLPDKNQPLTGKAKYLEAFGDDPDAFKLEWTPEKAEVSASGDLGWTWGRYKMTIFTGGDAIVTHGKYLDIWKKQDDGSWRLAVDMGNSNPEPEK